LAARAISGDPFFVWEEGAWPFGDMTALRGLFLRVVAIV